MHVPVRTVAPALTPVTLTEVKAHCRVEDTASDAVLTGLINAAVSHLDGWSGVIGRCLVTQTWRQDYDAFERCLRLPLGPVASITSVTSRNTAGQLATVNGDNYALKTDALGSYVRFKNDYTFPTDLNETSAVSVTYVAGSAVADVPAALKQAILLLVGLWFENRESTIIGNVAAVHLPVAVDALIAPYRRVGF